MTRDAIRRKINAIVEQYSWAMGQAHIAYTRSKFRLLRECKDDATLEMAIAEFVRVEKARE